jgi:hypothetical protein
MIGLRPELKAAIIHKVGDTITYAKVVEASKLVESAHKYSQNLTLQDPVGQLIHKINTIESKMGTLSMQRNDRSRSNSQNRNFNSHTSSPFRSRPNSPFRNNSPNYRSRNNQQMQRNDRKFFTSPSRFSKPDNSPFFPRNRTSPSYPNNHPSTPSYSNNNHRKPPFRKGSCFNCGRTGHHIKECRTKVTFQNK